MIRNLRPTLPRLTLIVLVIAIAVRFAITFLVHPSGDSFGHLVTARYIAQNLAIPLFEPIYSPFYYHPPVFHLLAAGLYLLFSVFGESVATKAMNFIAPLYGAVCLVVFYLFCRRILDAKKTFYAVIFLSFIPIHMYYSTIAHVDIATTTIIMITVYLLFTKRFVAAAIANGIGMLTKYVHLFIFPTLLVILSQQYARRPVFVKRSIIFFGIALVIGIPLYVRNLVYLGNPLWPFLNNIVMALGLHPLLVETRPIAAISNLWEPKYLIYSYLDTFGVPLGLPKNLFSFGIPSVALVGWFVMTLLFIAPLLVGFWTKKPRYLVSILSIWIGTYILMLVYYVYDFGDFFMRLGLPLYPALAIIWAYGFDAIVKKIKNPKLYIALFLILGLLCIAFTGIEFTKAHVAAKGYDSVQTDFDWIDSHLPADAIFDRHSPYLQYHLNRPVVSRLCKSTDYAQDQLYHYSDAIHGLERQPEKYTDWYVIYNNPVTGATLRKKTDPAH